MSLSRIGSSFRYEDSRVVGLRNAAGEQNCFLNVVIQALWRLRATREFLLNSKSSSRNNFVVLDALANLFSDYRITHEKILPPIEVRQTLAAIFAHLNRFQIGQMDDAGESLDGILASLHGSADIDKPCQDIRACLGHAVFALDAMNEPYCESCDWLESHPKETCFSYPVYAQELLDAMGTESFTSKLVLDQLIKYIKVRRGTECQKCHENTVYVRTFVFSLPQVLYINMIWPSIDVDKPNLRSILEMIAPCEDSFGTQAAFDFLEQDTDIPNYRLSGMICFYPGQHYVYIGKIEGEWAIFDDHQVRHIGNFQDVIDKCILAKYVPVSLFFERDDYSNQSKSSTSTTQARNLVMPYTINDNLTQYSGNDDAGQRLREERIIRERRPRTPSPSRIQSSPISTMATTSSTGLDASRAVPKQASVGYGTTRRREEAATLKQEDAALFYDTDRFVAVQLDEFAPGIPRRY